MPKIVLNDDEWEVLFDEPPSYFKVYVGVRRVMDYETMIAGQRSRLNEQAIKEMLEVPAKPGRKKYPKIERGEIRHILESLCRLGLLARRADLGKFIFELPKASGVSPSKRGTTKPTTNSETIGAAKQDDGESLENKGFSEKKHSRCNQSHDHSYNQRYNHPQSINNNINNINIINNINVIFEHWKSVMNHPRAKLDDTRKKAIKKALRLGYDVEQLQQAITGCSKTPFNMGDNDRGQVYDRLNLILRDADQIERFINNFHNPPTTGRGRDETNRRDRVGGKNERFSQWLDEARGKSRAVEGELADSKPGTRGIDFQEV